MAGGALALITTRIGVPAETCHHAEALERQVILIQARRPFVACLECYRLFGELIEAFHDGRIGPFEVANRLADVGYGRLDQARFVLQVVADRLRVRLGFADQEAFDVNL